MELYIEFKKLVLALNADKISYAICGGMAMAFYDVPRTTIDIDIMIEESSLEASKEIARRQGFTVDTGLLELGKGAIKIYRLLKVDREYGDELMLDLLLVTPAIKNAWETREKRELEWGSVSVVSREGLIHLKSFRASGRDRDDISRLKGEGNAD